MQLKNYLLILEIMKNKSFYDPENIGLVHLVNQALKANLLYQNGRDYIVKNNEDNNN